MPFNERFEDLLFGFLIQKAYSQTARQSGKPLVSAHLGRVVNKPPRSNPFHAGSLADDEADEEEEESDDDPEEFTETHPLSASRPATARDTKTGAFLEVIFIGSSFLCDC